MFGERDFNTPSIPTSKFLLLHNISYWGWYPVILLCTFTNTRKNTNALCKKVPVLTVNYLVSMPSARAIKARNRQYYNSYAEGIRSRKRDKYQNNPQNKKDASRASYKADPNKAKETARKQYNNNPEHQKATSHDRYRTHSETIKEDARKQYKSNPEPKRGIVR